MTLRQKLAFEPIWLHSIQATRCLNKGIIFLLGEELSLIPFLISSCVYSDLIICSILEIDCLATTTALGY